MFRVYPIFCALTVLASLASGVASAIDAAAPAPPEAAVTEALAPATPVPVTFRGHELLVVRAPIGALSIAERARAIEDRLGQAFAQPDLDPGMLRTQNAPNSTDVYMGSQFILSVMDQDAQPLGRTRRQLVADDMAVFEQLITEEIKAGSLKSLLFSAIWSVVAIVIASVAIWVSMRGLARAQRGLARIAKSKVSVVRIGTLTLFSPKYAMPIISALVQTLRWLIVATVLFAATAFVLDQFPWTRGFAEQTTRVALAALGWAVGGILRFLPNVFYIVVIVIATRFLLKILHAVLEQLGRSQTTAQKFPPEWVEPTYQIARFTVVALAVVVAFPYLPGSDSKAFQGVSIFVGVLLSLGSTAAIANLIAGIVLIYMRALGEGDRVKVADTIGDVISCDMLAMKVRTIKNVDISVPNALILSNHVINYSRQAREGRLILHTTVTIGYDAEWRKVHELLIKAALATKDVQKDPGPFVLQTSLNDFFVSYELNVYTHEAQAMARIYSDLHANIQDAFNEAGVEIMSPQYTAVRDGNRLALPDEHLPKNYRAPAFGLSLFRTKPAGA